MWECNISSMRCHEDMKPSLQREVRLHLGFGEWLAFELVKGKGERISSKLSRNMEIGTVMVRKQGTSMGKLWWNQRFVLESRRRPHLVGLRFGLFLMRNLELKHGRRYLTFIEIFVEWMSYILVPTLLSLWFIPSHLLLFFLFPRALWPFSNFLLFPTHIRLFTSSYERERSILIILNQIQLLFVNLAKEAVRSTSPFSEPSSLLCASGPWERLHVAMLGFWADGSAVGAPCRSPTAQSSVAMPTWQTLVGQNSG